MIVLDDFKAYKYYLALRLHFTTDQYDVIKYNGKVNATRASFEKRKDLYNIKRIVKKFNEKEIVNFLVANFVSGNKWGGMFDVDAEKTYAEWLKKTESLGYLFRNDLDFLATECEKVNKEFLYIFEGTGNNHPLVIKAYLGKKISLETLVILNDVYSFVDGLDKLLYDDIAWADISRLVKKYKPFLKYDGKKINDYIADRLGS